MLGLMYFVLSVVLLVLGYFVYGKLAERIYGVAPNMKMPCEQQQDGVDFVPMSTWRVFLIQLLNIAGLGPVFGALAGCLFGPACLLWIVFGCIFAGAVHDFFAALASAENRGANLPELIGKYLGKVARVLMQGVCLVLMLLVGVVFTAGPADMLHSLISWPTEVWCAMILGYYFLATILPIDVIIGKIYPFFGALFLVMAVGLMVTLPFCGYEVVPDTDFFANLHPKGYSIWPLLFVTVACGAISGFHATQSPMMVRCMPEARHMRPVFYGAMIMEGIVALVWAVAGLTLRDVIGLGAGTSVPDAVTRICELLLGPVGAVLAILGVVVLPITSGDTAMRCCRLLLADSCRLSQKPIFNRLLLAVPLFVLVIIISRLEYDVIWQYFGWVNQALACFTLWAMAVLLRRRGRFHWVISLPAVLMTSVCICFPLYVPMCRICLDLPVASAIAVGVSLLFLVGFLFKCRPATARSAH